MKIKVKKLDPDAIIPSHLLHGDAGLDLHSIEDKILSPGERYPVKTGLAFELPEGYVGLLWDKSGTAFKTGLKTMGGVMDCTYRGEYMVLIWNTTSSKFAIKKGDKIAQVLIQPVASVEIEEVGELSKSIRGEHSFGTADEVKKKL